jgi:hypothetical protein
MRHTRPDYQRIQDPDNLIPADEPVFLLRAQDRFAPVVVEAWAALMAATGDRVSCNLAAAQAAFMRAWQAEHAVKTPDLPEGANLG